MSDTADYRTSKPLFNKGRTGWALFDWANQGFTTIVITFIFGVYFQSGVVGDPVQGQALWATAISISAAVIAILAPILGALADLGGRRKPWVVGFSWACILLTVGLYFVLPDPSYTFYMMVVVASANIAYELAIVFNNAMLSDLVDRPRLAKLGGVAWSGGYFGGLITLVIALAIFFGGEGMGLNEETQQPVRATALVVAAWFAIFLIPFMLWTPDRAPTGRSIAECISQGLGQLWHTLKTIFSSDRNMFGFLMGRMFYADAVATVFSIGAVYASSRFDLAMTELILFGILLNVFSGLGGVVFAMIEERLGTKSVILTSIVGLTISATIMLFMDSFNLFVIVACLFGVFVGPIQQASRTMLAKLAPLDVQAELFGLYALTGKATSWAGPLAVAVVTAWAGREGLANANQLGMLTILPFFVIGFVIMLFVKEQYRE